MTADTITYSEVCTAHSRLDEAAKRMLDLRGKVYRGEVAPDAAAAEWASIAKLVAPVVAKGGQA